LAKHPRAAVVLLLLLLAGCALPENTALRDWARTASVTADRPSLLPAGDALLAQQEALAIHLQALSVLARPEQTLAFDADAHARIRARAGADPRAARALAALGEALRAARAANLPPGARADSAHPAPLVEDRRLVPFIAASDPPLQALLAILAGGLGDGAAAPGRAAYLRVLGAIAEDHAMIASLAAHVEEREAARRMQAAEDRLLRLAFLLPADPAVAGREGRAGAVARVAQP
jgi:hypothetical protein